MTYTGTREGWDQSKAAEMSATASEVLEKNNNTFSKSLLRF